MTAVYLKCDRCPYDVRVNTSYEDAIARLNDHRERTHNQQQDFATDGGSTLQQADANADSTQDPDSHGPYRVTWHSAGVQCASEPMPLSRAREFANAISEAVVKIDLGERPLADDHRATIQPVEVSDG